MVSRPFAKPFASPFAKALCKRHHARDGGCSDSGAERLCEGRCEGAWKSLVPKRWKHIKVINKSSSFIYSLKIILHSL